MADNSNIVCGIHHLKLAMEYFEDFQRQHPATKGATLFKVYCGKINWMLNDLITHPALPEVVREGIKKEINSDLLAIPAIAEKIALLKPESREAVEDLIETILGGAELIIENNKNIPPSALKGAGTVENGNAG